MFHIALFEPRIAPNTGNIIRLSANNGCCLHLIEPLGFNLEEKNVRRAGLDYHDMARVSRHINFAAFVDSLPGRRIIACTTKGVVDHASIAYQPDDILLFGSETSGLPPVVLDSIAPELRARIPMQAGSRSLNLSNAVAIVSYEAWRQQAFDGASG
ncbi:MAG: tRNA (cytidine(34)-2'-O)-methyltransferase [Halioglobus sp.]